MRKGIATPETNKGKKLVLPVRTMNVIEAYKALNLGHSIDIMAGYYEQEGILNTDFYMMDRIGKLHALAGYKEQLREAKGKYEADIAVLRDEEEKRKFNQAVEMEIQKRNINEQQAKE